MAASKQEKQYEFGPFSIDAAERVLLREGQPLALTPKIFDLLLVLVENRGHLMEKKELMQRLWPSAFVEEANLSNNISLLRKALGDDCAEHQYIETVPRRGYRFVASVLERSGQTADLIVEERTRTTLTLEQESNGELEPGRDFRAPSAAKRRHGPVVVAFAVLACAAWAAYFVSHKDQATSPPIRSIAVLPFKPLIPDDRDESLEMGMAETLITRLSNLRQVIVRPMSAVRTYTALEQDPVAAGREQRVDAVLDGDVQKTGNRVRITVHLVRVSDGHILWTDKFDERLADIFALEDSISERVAAVMVVKLTGEERELLTRHPTENTEAYQLYLKGRLYYQQWTQESIQKALECFDKAVAVDPNYALAYAGKADLYSANSSMFLPPAEAMPKAREAAEKALSIDDQLSEAHHSMAMVKMWADWDWSAAESEFRRALEINPNDAQLHAHYGSFIVDQKRFDEAFGELERARELDPLSFSVTYTLGKTLYLARRYDQAIVQYQEVVALYPNRFQGHRGLGCVLRQKGMYEEAIAQLQRAVDLQPLDSCLSELGNAFGSAARRNEAMKLVKKLEATAKVRYVSPVDIARIYAGLGETDLVFDWLRKAYGDHSDHLLKLGVDPSFDSVRSDPRFAGLLRRVGLEQ